MDAQLKFVEYVPEDAQKLVQWISREEWPFHGSSKPQPGKVQKWVSDGDFEGDDNRTFWIYMSGQTEPVGLVALHELIDDTPIFDLRLRQVQRNKQLQTIAP